MHSSTGNSITFPGLNIKTDFSYSISSGDSRFYVNPSTGLVSSGVSDKTIYISFISSYTLDFYQSLNGDSQWLNGDSWTVNINGQQYGPTHNNVIKVSGLNPFTQYSYSVTTTDSFFSLSPSSSSYKFDGSSLEPAISISFKSAKVLHSLFSGSCTVLPNDPIYFSPPLYVFDCLALTEFEIDAINAISLLVSAFLTFSAPLVIPKVGIIVEETVLTILGIGAVSADLINFYNIVMNFVAAVSGTESDIAFIGSLLFTILPYIASFLLSYIYPLLDFLVQASVISDVTYQSGITFLTDYAAGILIAIEKAAVIGGAIWWLIGVKSDFSDTDDVSNMPF